MRGWFRNRCLVLGQGTYTQYNLSKVYYKWTPDGSVLEPSTILLWPMVESLSWSSLLFWNDPRGRADALLARRLYQEVAHYHQASPGATVNPSNRAGYSPIAMRMLRYPNSESKVIGMTLLWGKALPAVRKLYFGN